MNEAFTSKQHVDKALEALRIGLSPYVSKLMKEHYGDDWIEHASYGKGVTKIRELDTYRLLKTILDQYNAIFREDIKLRRVRSYVTISLEARNASSHFEGFMENREALRYLDAMSKLLEAVGADKQAKEVDQLYDEQLNIQSQNKDFKDEQAKLKELKTKSFLQSKLHPWHEVVQPHADVLKSHFTEAEFGADLAQVDSSEEAEEYKDPQEFFRITYLTEGLRQVLHKAVERLAKKGGDPVIGLQTNFGGGKTHTMLALYHLAGEKSKKYQTKDLYGVGSILQDAGVDNLPDINRAVFSGTHKGPSEAMHASGGREVRTVWGYIAYCLGGWDAVDKIADSEKNYTNPGSEKLANILKTASPCIILIDEVVAFAKQLEGIRYEAFHAFLQSLTEATKMTPGALVVGSLPESKKEAGGEDGAEALERLEKLFGRIQSAWTPASGLETFEIVRRRLFEPLDQEGKKVRDATVQAFIRSYRANASDFPPRARERSYQEEMLRAYPIHPEVLKCFSEQWSTLEKFQRTRGILKIMANAIYTLWRDRNSDPLITLASLPLKEDKLRTAILEPLGPAYGPILQSEVDGEMAMPAQLEATRTRIGGMSAATRAARAVFLATAPHDGSSRGGMTESALRLAVAKPDEQLAIFSEALQILSEGAAYLYHENGRYWFSTHMTLNKKAEERASSISESEVDAAIVAILREEEADKGGFLRVHVAPSNLEDVNDNRDAALVVVAPSLLYKPKNPGKTPDVEPAISDALKRCGSGQRNFRNTLIFVAADEQGINACRDIGRKYLAWRSIVEDTEMARNLTGEQKSNATRRMEQSWEGLKQSTRSTWSHVLYPAPANDGGSGLGMAKGFNLEHLSISNRSSGKGIARRIYEKLTINSIITVKLGPDTLMSVLEEIWKKDNPHIKIGMLLDWFASYTYLPRLQDGEILIKAIEELIKKIDSPVAFAECYDERSGEYQGVAYIPTNKGLLVWRNLLPEKKDGSTLAKPTGLESDKPQEEEGSDSSSNTDKTRPIRRFYGSIPLGLENPEVQIARIVREILHELEKPEGVVLKLTLEIDANAPNGYSNDIIDVVRSNIRDLKLDRNEIGFEEE